MVTHFGRSPALHLQDQQRLVGVAVNHLLGLVQHSLLDVSLAGAIQVVHGLLQALESFPHLVLLPLGDHCGAQSLRAETQASEVHDEEQDWGTGAGHYCGPLTTLAVTTCHHPLVSSLMPKEPLQTEQHCVAMVSHYRWIFQEMFLTMQISPHSVKLYLQASGGHSGQLIVCLTKYASPKKANVENLQE